VAVIVGSFALAGCGEWLAGVAAAHDVDGFDGRPVDFGDVVQIGHVGPVCGKDFGCCGVVFALPGAFGCEHFLDG